MLAGGGKILSQQLIFDREFSQQVVVSQLTHTGIWKSKISNEWFIVFFEALGYRQRCQVGWVNRLNPSWIKPLRISNPSMDWAGRSLRR